jgi:RNA polymerase sigma-70 factor, ECF subfamily
MVDENAFLKTFLSEQPAAILDGLFELYADRIYRMALSILNDPLLAEDMVQETFLSAITHRASFAGRSRLNTWLYRIAYNACQDQLRRRPMSALPEGDGDFPDEAPVPMPQTIATWPMTPEQAYLDRETQVELDRAILGLPPNLRAVFLLRDIEDLSIQETAEALGISTGAVKVRLHRARLLLRERMSEYYSERLAS